MELLTKAKRSYKLLNFKYFFFLILFKYIYLLSTEMM